MLIKKFDLIQHAPGLAEACRFLMPISGGAPDDKEKADDDEKEEKTDDQAIQDMLEANENADDKDDKKDDDKADDTDDNKAEAPDEDDDDPKIDPKDDYEITLKGGKKIMYSELAKLQKQGATFTKKSQSLSEGMKELKALKDMNEFLRANPNKLKKVIDIINEAQEAADEAKEDGGDKEDVADAMAEVFKKLDMSKPENILLKTLVENNQKIMKKISDVEKQDKTFAKTEQEKEFKQKTEAATTLLNGAFEATFKELKVTDKEEIGMIRQMALSFMKDNPKQYKDDDDFKATVVQITKKFSAALNKFGEAKLAAYLKNKGGNGSRSASRADDGKAKPSKEKTDIGKGENLQEEILAALTDAENGTLEVD